MTALSDSKVLWPEALGCTRRDGMDGAAIQGVATLDLTDAVSGWCRGPGSTLGLHSDRTACGGLDLPRCRATPAARARAPGGEDLQYFRMFTEPVFP